MWRTLAFPLLFMLTASAAPARVVVPNAEELGRALASNNDWRAITIVLVLLMFGSWAGMAAQARSHRLAMLAKDNAHQGNTDRLIAALDKSSGAQASGAQTIASFAMSMARIEAIISRIEGQRQ